MDSQSDNSLAGGRRLRLRFSLLALLIFMTAACLLLAWVVQPRRYVAATLFNVSSVRATVLSSPTPFDAREFDTFCRSQVAFVKSPYVLQAALRDPAVAKLPMIAAQADPVAWLGDHIEVFFPQNSEILCIDLHGTEAQADQLSKLVDAVAMAYQKEVVLVEDQRRLATRDAKAKSVSKLRGEIEIKMKAFEQEAAVGPSASETNKAEIETLMELWREMLKSLQTDDVDASAPPRIRLLQPATVHRE